MKGMGGYSLSDNVYVYPTLVYPWHAPSPVIPVRALEDNSDKRAGIVLIA